MKRFFLLIILTSGLLYGKSSTAQETQVIINKDTSIQKASDTTVCCKMDTIHYGPVTIIRKDEGDKTVTAKVIWGNAEISDKDTARKERPDVKLSWFGFDFGWNNYVDRSDYGAAEVNDFAPGQPEATKDMFSVRGGKSVNVNIWPVLVKVNLVRHYLGLKTGIGIEMNNYRYTKNISYKNDISRTYIFRDSISFRKNKLFTEYLTIPVMLTVESNPYHNGRSFHFAAGATFGYLVKSKTKQISSERGKKKYRDPFNLEQFRTGLRAELGYGPITLYGAYSFTPIHQYGLKQYPFSIGIVLLGGGN